MITKQIAGLLYTFSYQLQDNEGNVWSIEGINGATFNCYKLDIGIVPDFEEVCWSEIGSTYKILAREMDLIKPIDGVGIPIVELAKIAFPSRNWNQVNKKNVVSDDELGFEWDANGFEAYRMHDGVMRPVYNQLSLFNWLYTHHFNLDFPEGTTTNLI